MAVRSNRSHRERMKYGLCLNEECEKCKTKEVQAIPMRKEFVCPNCGKELRECPPPKKSNKGLIIGAIVALLAIATGIFIMCLSGGKTSKTLSALDSDTIVTTPDTIVEIPDTTPKISVKSDTIIKMDDNTNVRKEGTKVIEEHITSTHTTITTHQSSSSVSSSRNRGQGGSSSSTLNLSYGKYVGEVKGGYPNGMGRITYTKARQISKYDTKARTADVGDYIIGEFENGFLVQGKHFDKDNNLIESLMIGSIGEGVYEQK